MKWKRNGWQKKFKEEAKAKTESNKIKREKERLKRQELAIGHFFPKFSSGANSGRNYVIVKISKSANDETKKEAQAVLFPNISTNNCK